MSKRNLTTSIIGDAGSADATVVPNLESLNTGSDSYVSSISDTSELNVFGTLKIYDNYWDTLFARHIINASNSGAAPGTLMQVNIQGSTEGWVRADHMVLMVPITFQYIWEYCRRSASEYIVGLTITSGSNRVDDALLTTGATPFAWEDHAFLNNPSVQFAPEVLTSFKHSWLGCLDIFERIRILVGNNAQAVQKQIETEPIGMKYHMAHGRYGGVLEKTVGEWGVLNPIGFEMYDVPVSNLVAVENFLNTNLEWGPAGNALLMWPRNIAALSVLSRNCHGSGADDTNNSFFRMIGSANSVSNYDTRNVLLGTQSSRRWCQVTRKRNLTLPLQAINTFFRGAKFLPPDFRFKFEIEINSGRIIMRKDTSVALNNFPISTENAYHGMSPMQSYAHCKATAVASGIEFQYPYHILRQPVQATISSMWLQKPFLYNYETIQSTEVIPNKGQTFISFTISISTQRPTILDAYLFPISTMDIWETDFIRCHPYSTTAGNTVPSGYRIKNTPHNHGDLDNITNVNKNSTMAGPCSWSNLEIMFSGRTAYRFLNNYSSVNAQGNDSIQPNEFFVQLFEEQSMRSTGTEYNARSFVERGGAKNDILVNNHNSNRLLRLNIQPGGWTDRGVISSRQGATTITININFNRPLSDKDRFLILRTNPEQMVFDSDKCVTLVQWPAIKSNMGYLIPNITAAP